MHSFDTVTKDAKWTAGSLAEALPPLVESMTCAEVFEWFRTRPTQVAAAVVDEDSNVLGIVNRLRFFAKYAQRYFPEIYGNSPITKLANTKPLIVDEHVPTAELAVTLTLDLPDALRECFVVTRGNRYFGIGTSEALIRSKMALLTAREAELKTALARASESNRTKSNFLALMSHELRTPLNAIIGFSEVMTKTLFGPIGNERYLEYAGDIHGAGKHLLNLINDILDLSKAEAGKLELNLEPVDLSVLFEESVRLISGRAKDQRVQLAVYVSPDLPLFYADALRTKQIMINLLSNAVKFTPAGGTVQLTAGLGPDGGFVLSVRDTGIGMSPETIPLALEPFRQIASPMSRNVEGTGLGLSLVKILTEQLGGVVTIESELHVGTEVTLRFPASRTIAPSEKTPRLRLAGHQVTH